jgi:hypothetical protein
MADWGMLRGRAANVQRCHVRNRHLPARQPSGCCLLPEGRPASGAPMPGYGARWRGEHRRTLAVRAARGVWAAPKHGHQWEQGVGRTQPMEKAV